MAGASKKKDAVKDLVAFLEAKKEIWSKPTPEMLKALFELVLESKK